MGQEASTVDMPLQRFIVFIAVIRYARLFLFRRAGMGSMLVVTSMLVVCRIDPT